MSESPSPASGVAATAESGRSWRDAVVYLVVATAAMAPMDVTVVGAGALLALHR